MAQEVLEQDPERDRGILEVELARLICDAVPSVELVRMVNSGTEATMSAVRVARGFTGREKIVKFIGCYHGHSDGFLAAAGMAAGGFLKSKEPAEVPPPAA